MIRNCKKPALVLIYSVFAIALQAQPLTDSVVQLEEVICYQRLAGQWQEAGQKVSILKNENDLNLNMTTADLLEKSGKVFVQKSQMGGGSPVIRGFEANRILFVVDNVKMNNAVYRGGHLQNIITVDPEILERIELKYGPSSTLQGADAIGGSIYLKTIDPEIRRESPFFLNGNASLMYNSANNGYTGHLSGKYGSGNWGFLTSLSYKSFGDLRQGSRTSASSGDSWFRYYYPGSENGQDVMLENKDPLVQKFSGYKQADFLQKIYYSPKEGTEHRLNIQYSTSTDIPRYDRLSEIKDSVLRWAEWYYGPQERFMAAYEYADQNFPLFFDEALFHVDYQKIEESRHQRRFEDDNRESRIEDLDVIGYSIDLKKNYARSDLRFGVDGQWNRVASAAFSEHIMSGHKEYNIDTRYPDGGSTMFYSGIYYYQNFRFEDPSSILEWGGRLQYSNLEARFDDTSILNLPFRKAEQENVTYSFNASYLKSFGRSGISVSLESGFRVPNVDDLAKVFESAGGVQVVVPNPDIRPEQSIGIALNSHLVPHKDLTFNFSAYYTQLYHALVLDRFTLNGMDSIDYNGVYTAVVANQNKAKAYIYGFELGLEYDFLTNFYFRSDLAYTYGRFINDEREKVPMDHIPPLFGKSALGWMKEKMAFEINSRYAGWKRLEDYNPYGEDNLNYATPEGMPSWWTLNINGSYRFEKFTIALGLENILDRNYRMFASGISAPGINVVGKLTYQF